MPDAIDISQPFEQNVPHLDQVPSSENHGEEVGLTHVDATTGKANMVDVVQVRHEPKLHQYRSEDKTTQVEVWEHEYLQMYGRDCSGLGPPPPSVWDGAHQMLLNH